MNTTEAPTEGQIGPTDKFGDQIQIKGKWEPIPNWHRHPSESFIWNSERYAWIVEPIHGTLHPTTPHLQWEADLRQWISLGG